MVIGLRTWTSGTDYTAILKVSGDKSPTASASDRNYGLSTTLQTIKVRDLCRYVAGILHALHAYVRGFIRFGKMSLYKMEG